MRIILTGDRAQAIHLKHMAQEQLRILREAMDFRGLTYWWRTLRFKNGVVIKAWSNRNGLTDLDAISIHVPVGVAVVKEAVQPGLVERCWCTCCFTQGTVLEVLGSYGDWDEGASYETWTGIRYRVSMCRGATYEEQVVLSSDFAQYAMDDLVSLLYIGTAEGPSTCLGCRTCGREACGPKSGGRWIILPLAIRETAERVSDAHA